MIKAEWCSLPEIKSQKGKNLRNYAGSIHTYKKAEKIVRVMMIKVTTSSKSGNHKSTMKNKTHYSL